MQSIELHIQLYVYAEEREIERERAYVTGTSVSQRETVYICHLYRQIIGSYHSHRRAA